MDEPRIHRAVSADGTEIAGRVYGDGPPLVLVHGALADGELEWGPVVRLLTEHFSCYLPDLRCRGLSGQSEDLAPERLVEDVTAFVDSIGSPVGLAGASGGGMYVLAAAARSAAVVAVAAWEPVVFEVVDDQLVAEFQGVLERMGAEHADGQDVEAATTFLAFVGNDEEMSALAASGSLAECARYVPVDLTEIQQAFEEQGPTPTDPTVLAQITAPVLLLAGTESRQGEWFGRGVRFAAEHLPDAQVREISGIGHLTHEVRPEPLARELREFFATTLEKAPASSQVS